MRVRFHPAIESFLPLDNPHGYNQAFPPEKVDIPVHRGQRKARDIRF
jgi:hypothetical protein